MGVDTVSISGSSSTWRRLDTLLVAFVGTRSTLSIEERVLCRVVLCGGGAGGAGGGGISSECTGVWLDLRFDVLVGAVALGTAALGAALDAALGAAFGAGSGGSSRLSFFFAGRPLLAAGLATGFGAGASSSSGMGSGCAVFTRLEPRVK
ncbi:hypothetical protein ONZ43_g513 [Nemania bipapillata]|uniref:Uncharacterized protein n=1 Tax=Nemania bipapillata TaxID=110536 RepID=A0ACC2J7V4_9PEZI|nr:hypothetical protein ONZ43_g513 [Nemania bipapillata]